MYFEQFANGGASVEPVSHVDILTMACEGAEFCGEAEVALIEEDGRLCMTVGAEAIGDAMAAVADKAKEVGTKIWKWLVEFARKVRAFVSQAIVSLRSGAIASALKRIIAKASAKAKNDDWKENAPKPERVTKWNVESKKAINGIWFITKTAVDKFLTQTDKAFKKLNTQMGKSEAFGGSYDENQNDNVGELESILDEIPKITDENGHTTGYSNKEHDNVGTKGANSKWLERLDGNFVHALELESNQNNEQIIRSALAAAKLLIGKMQADPILKCYDAIKLLDTEVNLAKKLAADAGKSGARELKRIKKIQKAVSKVGTTATLFCRRQLGAYKKATALVMRLYSMAGSMEREDYRED